ncbi:hypothetical protein [Polaromonas sp. SM01]|uniref:hypothetical protein n=1 Tax=Polaromonas sp. SM01 TaxID=3085630 RepID=UPI00298172FD|nr:hypothetical protein [Polaromonas sp. SM01]MDW5440947.1 hypothetical protein [Polaromonas sp. SM01]
MSSTEKIAIAAHLHVLLRRKTGRVTDTEWMAGNAAYAAEIVRFAREKADQDGHVDLGVWADRLEEIMALTDTKHRVPLAKVVADAVKARTSAASAPPVVDSQRARSVDTEEEIYPASGFIESSFGALFGDNEAQRPRERRDPDAPRYVKGLR